MSGRARDNRLVHFAVPAAGESPRPGDLVTARITYAAPHHLVADSALDGGRYAVRRTRAGDVPASASGFPVHGEHVLLGMPTLGVPAPAGPAAVCAAV
jgi:tRNA-2-methylthio-N6-dimethylallyladenosine synthase